MDEKGADNVIECAEGALCFAILWRGIGAGETNKDAVLKKKLSVLSIVKFMAIVALDEANGKEEVGVDSVEN